MADEAPTPSPRRSGNRLHAFGKLTALIGLPLLVLGSLFGGGLWYGATHSYRIAGLEAKFLGFAEPEGATWTPPGTLPQGEGPTAEPAGETGEEAGGETGSGGETGGAEQPTEPKPQPVEQPTEPKPQPVEQPSSSLAVAAASPISAELRAHFDAPLVVRVKVLVDPALAIAREDWLAYVAEVFAASDASFEGLFGVELRLQGVVLWDAAPGADPQTLLTELKTHEREGAEVVIGLLARPAPGDFTPQAWTGEVHGDHGLVFADLERDDRYYQNMLRTIAGLLGASPSPDQAPGSSGSFMSLSGTPDGKPPVLDPGNRGQVIIHKRRPFTDSRSDATDDGDAKPSTEGDAPEGDNQEI